MVSTLYRTEKDDTYKTDGSGILFVTIDALKEMAGEVLALIKQHVGTSKFVETYQEVSDGINSVRRERRSARAIQAVVDPKARAVRRFQKNEMKKNGRKRKSEETLSKYGKVKRVSSK